MEFLLYFVACLFIAIICAILFKLCGINEDEAVVLATIWPISVPAIILSIIIHILIIIPIEFVLKKMN